MKWMISLIYRVNSARILSLFSHLSDQYLLLPVEQINKFKMIVLSTKSCSVREITTLEQENNAMKFCLHYCLHWNIPVIFHFSSCVTRHRMSRSNEMSESFKWQCIWTIFFIINRVLSRSDFAPGSLICIHFLCRRAMFWLTINHLIRWIYDNGADFFVIIELCGYRKRKEFRKILALGWLWSARVKLFHL
jgi:hypothetical protein